MGWAVNTGDEIRGNKGLILCSQPNGTEKKDRGDGTDRKEARKPE
jgi:hypothetical protein